jgi:DNA-binding winged helix-turn-helix (wHTH) protein
VGNATQPKPHVRFAEFDLDLSTRELRVNGQTKLVLQEQPFQILAALLERAGRLVTHDELRQRLWPSDTYVDFQRSLHKAVNRLRDILGDSADEPRFIETLPRQGYRFIASAEPVRSNNNDGISEARTGNLRWVFITCTFALIAVSLILFRVANRTHLPSVVLPELKQLQLTDNLVENPVSSGAISADGKYLAYADLKGIHIKLIETGETANLPEPDEVKGKPVSWKILSPWVLDGTRLVANAYSPGSPPSIWTIPLVGGVAPQDSR